MAGIGPAPNPQRRRRNVPARGEWVDLEPLEKPVLPAAPPIKPPKGRYRALTMHVWKAWRSDPVTAQWSPADVAYAIDTILLHNAMTVAANASEVRLRMDSLGLTPKGKRDLRWRITDEPFDAPVQNDAPKERRLRAV